MLLLKATEQFRFLVCKLHRNLNNSIKFLEIVIMIVLIFTQYILIGRVQICVDATQIRTIRLYRYTSKYSQNRYNHRKIFHSMFEYIPLHILIKCINAMLFIIFAYINNIFIRYYPTFNWEIKYFVTHIRFVFQR